MGRQVPPLTRLWMLLHSDDGNRVAEYIIVIGACVLLVLFICGVRP